MNSEADYKGLVTKVLAAEHATFERQMAMEIGSCDEIVQGDQKDLLSIRYKYGVYAIHKCKFPEKSQIDMKAMGCDVEYDDIKWMVFYEKAESDLRELESTGALLLDGKHVKLYFKALQNVLNGLVNMHRNHHFHGDVKPENMLLFGKTAKLGDFGLSITRSDTRSSSYLKQKILHKLPSFNQPPAASIIFKSILETKKHHPRQKFLDLKRFPWRDGGEVTPKVFLRKLKTTYKDDEEDNKLVAEGNSLLPYPYEPSGLQYAYDLNLDMHQFLSRLDMYGVGLCLLQVQAWAQTLGWDDVDDRLGKFLLRLALMDMTDDEVLASYNILLSIIEAQ